jgi:hypothetical protein
MSCVDYRRLLWKYMRHVEAEEGYTLLDTLDYERSHDRPHFTGAERDELMRLESMSTYDPTAGCH